MKGEIYETLIHFILSIKWQKLCLTLVLFTIIPRKRHELISHVSKFIHVIYSVLQRNSGLRSSVLLRHYLRTLCDVALGWMKKLGLLICQTFFWRLPSMMDSAYEYINPLDTLFNLFIQFIPCARKLLSKVANIESALQSCGSWRNDKRFCRKRHVRRHTEKEPQTTLNSMQVDMMTQLHNKMKSASFFFFCGRTVRDTYSFYSEFIRRDMVRYIFRTQDVWARGPTPRGNGRLTRDNLCRAQQGLESVLRVLLRADLCAVLQGGTRAQGPHLWRGSSG